jgi:allatostatin receptor
VLVVAANQQMRSTTNLLIINLAVADLLFIIFCVPFTATDYVLPFWPFGDTWCKIVQYLIVVTAYASVYTLVLMSLDRFLAVVHPITSMSVSKSSSLSHFEFLQYTDIGIHNSDYGRVLGVYDVLTSEAKQF